MPSPLRLLYAADAARLPDLPGISHLLVPPAAPGVRCGERFLLATLKVPVPASRWPVLLDMTLDAVAAGSPLAEAPFTAPEGEALLDPRRTEPAGEARAWADTPEEADRLAAWWMPHLARWHGAGAAGFRLLGLAAFPPAALAALGARLRAALPDALLLAWSPGLAPAQTDALAALAPDGVFDSLAWWDGEADWLWRERARLASIAPVIATPELPHGPHRADYAAQAAFAAFTATHWLATRPGPETAAVLAATADLPAGPLTTAGPALLRTDTDPRQATRAAALVRGPAAALNAALSGRLAFPPPDPNPPDGWQILHAAPLAMPHDDTTPDAAAARRAAAGPRLGIEAIAPAVDGGAFPAKAIAGESVEVSADIVFDGHEQIAAVVRQRAPGATAWAETAMRPLGNDRWGATLEIPTLGRHRFQVLAWYDRWESWRDEIRKKHEAGVDTRLELQEGEALLREAAGRSPALARLAAELSPLEPEARRARLLAPDVAALMRAADSRPHLAASAEIPIEADRIGAGFASWYEVFPRSLSDDPQRHGTFRDVIRHLPRIAGMGFDVLYFPPIHPIGRRNRKGRNNSLEPAPDDPGSPYAIGADEGGHDALLPALGSFADFAALREAATAHGLEIALDFAVQCAPDHPWLAQHPGWFDWRPDGSIKYAENPPKKYQDIVNVDFYARDAVPGLWLELLRVVLFWCGHGVRLFRVDNPHTKPFPFWEWLIATVRARHPDAIFLAEAFTRPKIMYRLAKIGFGQSYTYFTWRNTKAELTEYLTELAHGEPAAFFRPHFFVNTPDINPVFLQGSGRPGFLIRAALAATLSGLWGMYNGFELCESAALPGREEYLDSEKYQLRAWDWQRPGNITAEIAALNAARRRNPALQSHLGVTFLDAPNDAVLAYEKATRDRRNVVLVAISLDPHNAQSVAFDVPLWRWQLPDDGRVTADDLMTGERASWQGRRHHVTLSPERPFALWNVRPEV